MAEETSRAAEAARLRIADIVSDSIVDGPGLRLAVFTQGCPHRCPGCHNPQSHDPEGGRWEAVSAIAARFAANPLLSGVTLTGGEPMEQAAACLALLAALPAGTNVWIYTGWTLEEILQSGDEHRIALARACDVLVDGRFVLAERSLALAYRGSRNQRLIDMAATRAAGDIRLWTPPAW